MSTRDLRFLEKHPEEFGRVPELTRSELVGRQATWPTMNFDDCTCKSYVLVVRSQPELKTLVNNGSHVSMKPVSNLKCKSPSHSQRMARRGTGPIIEQLFEHKQCSCGEPIPKPAIAEKTSLPVSKVWSIRPDVAADQTLPET